MDLFATTTGVLAQERRTIESLITNLAGVSTNALDLVSEHRVRLDRDLTILTNVLQSVRTNMDSVQQVLDAGPLLVTGLAGAYSKQYHRIDLRTQVSPTVAQALSKLGVPKANIPCVPVDVACAVTQVAGANAKPAPAAATTTTLPPPGAPVVAAPGAPATAAAPAAPIDSIVRGLGSPGAAVAAAPTAAHRRTWSAERVASGSRGLGGFFRRAARMLMGAAA
jgi:ABC-type transporter Mla subunit MlaD